MAAVLSAVWLGFSVTQVDDTQEIMCIFCRFGILHLNDVPTASLSAEL